MQTEATRRLCAVLFVDMVDSVRLTRLDQQGTVDRWRALMSAVAAEELPKWSGRRVKLQGDGMLAEFESTVGAIECAIAIQARAARGEAAVEPHRRIRLRMGVHVADVIVDEFDIYGDGVNLAARLRDLGGADEIVVSAAVRDQLTDGVGVSIEDLGERKLKGLDRPVRAYRVWPPGPLPAGTPDRRRRVGDRPAIAVLPFRNLSGNPRHEFLGDLIAEDVIGDLSRLTDLYVISRLSTAPFRDRLYEPRNVAEMLGVRYVIAGSMLSDDSRLRLTAELTEAEAGHVVWSGRFEGSLANIFELQDRLSVEIATRAVPHLRQIEYRRVRSKRPEDLTAYELTLRAIDFMHGRSREDLERAQRLLAQAITTDPHYATPHVWLARSHVLRVGQGWSDDPQGDTRAAHRHAEDALERDSNDAYAIAVWGFVSAYLQKDVETALARYDRALAINPSAVWAWAWSASANAWRGQGEKAVELIQRAIALSPFDPHMYNFAAIACGAHAVAGNYDSAIDWGRRSIRENRLFSAAHKLLTISLALAGRTEDARAAAAELLALEPALTVGEFRTRHPGSVGPHIDRFCEGLSMAGVPR
jgi:TolB-like protein/class 3 adenylate cyclase/Tfp pilus assembly protein PilF